MAQRGRLAACQNPLRDAASLTYPRPRCLITVLEGKEHTDRLQADVDAASRLTARRSPSAFPSRNRSGSGEEQLNKFQVG
jgi:hypothetical protein